MISRAWRTLRPVRRPMSRDKSDTLLLMSACALVMAPHAFSLPPWISLLCLFLLAWRGWITVRGNRMPPRWLLLPVALLAMAGIYLTFRTFLGREAGVGMLVLLAALKLLEMRARRDLFVVIFLCFFLLLTRFFESQSIAAALLTAVCVVVLLTAQLSFQYGPRQPPLRRRLAIGAAILALAAPLTLVMFILFPRIEGPLWGMPGDASSARSGLSDSMAPGSISSMALSGEIAFRVRFSDPQAVPPARLLYWRGPVLGDYDGLTWSPLPLAFTATGANPLTPLGPPLRYQVTLEPNSRRSLFALDLPLEAPQLPGTSVRLADDRQLLARLPITRRVRYDALSYLQYQLQADLPATRLRAWLRLPDGINPAARAYALELRAGQAGDETVIERLLRDIRQQPYRYTLSPPPLQGSNTIDAFLFSTRAGFCEHYAGAFVFLMRAAGIPARVVTGYLGGEPNAVDGYVTVRQSDAHAWAEVWLAKRGWVRIDPTAAIAPERVEHDNAALGASALFDGLAGIGGRGGPWAQRLAAVRQNWDALNNAWNQSVLDYTSERQRNLLQTLGLGDASPVRLTALMAACAALVMAGLAWLLVRSRERIDPAKRLYRSLCRRLAQRGLARQPHEGPRSYGIRLATVGEGVLPAAKAQAVAEFLSLYEQLRYAAPGAWTQNHGRVPSLPVAPSAKVIKQLKLLLAHSQ
ncbi:MAG: transglutaminase TgpA family protein [Janthinobacterium lividum]